MQKRVHSLPCVKQRRGWMGGACRVCWAIEKGGAVRGQQGLFRFHTWLPMNGEKPWCPLIRTGEGSESRETGVPGREMGNPTSVWNTHTLNPPSFHELPHLLPLSPHHCLILDAVWIFILFLASYCFFHLTHFSCVPLCPSEIPRVWQGSFMTSVFVERNPSAKQESFYLAPRAKGLGLPLLPPTPSASL